MSTMARTVIVEAMHGCHELLADITRPGIQLISAASPGITGALEPPGTVLGLIKGPGNILTTHNIAMLAQQHPGMIISYIGRHPYKILASDVQAAVDREHKNVLHLRTAVGTLPLLFLAHSPISEAVAAYVVALTSDLLGGRYERITPLTIGAGNTFAVRRNHTFTLDQLNAITLPPHSRIAVLGAGDIGRMVMREFSRAGAQVFHAMMSARAGAALHTHFTPSIAASLQDLPDLDVLTLHVPPGVFVLLHQVRQVRLLINTASGNALDADELLHAMEEGRIHRALIDVFDQEGPSFNAVEAGCTGTARQSRFNPEPHPFDTAEERRRKAILRHLIAERRLFLTPHIAFYEIHALRAVLAQALTNLLWYDALLKDRE